MQHPSNRIQQSDQASLTDTATEERIGGQGSKCVVADFGISGRSAAVNELEVFVGRQDRGVEQYQPDVYSTRRLGEGDGD